MYYKPNFSKVVDRYKDWYKPNGKIKYLVILIPSEWNSYDYDLFIDQKSKKPLSKYNFKDHKELYNYIDYSISLISQYWKLKLDWNLDDDMIPTHTVKLGYAETAAAIAGVDPVYSTIGQTSYLEPIISSYDAFDLENLKFSKNTEWSLILKEGLEYLLKKAKGNFFVEGRFDASNPSDLAYQFRGKDIFLDFYDNPENVNKLLQKCTEVGIDFVEFFRTLIPSIEGGYPLTWHGGVWTPNKIYGHDGDNVADQVSKSIFSKFLLPYHNKLSEHFGGSIFGRDAVSEHLWSEIPKINKIAAFAPRSIKDKYEIDSKVLRRIIEETNNLPLILESSDMEIFMKYKNIVEERGIKTIFTAHCKNLGEAKRILEIVRGM